MVKSVRDVSISLDDYGGQRQQVARQAGSGSFAIRIDHLISQDFSTNPVLSVLILDEDNFSTRHRSGNLAADVQVRDHASKGECFSSWCAATCVVAADSIVISCGLTHFERTSFANRGGERCGDGFAELCTMQQHDKFAHSFVSPVVHWKNAVHDRVPSVPCS